MRFVSILVFVLACTMVNGQNNFLRTIDETFIPAVDRDEYEDIDFEWNMPGKIQAFMNEGLTQLKESNYTVAAENFREVIKLDPRVWPAHYYLGVVNKALNEKEAEKNFKDALRISKQWQIYYQLGDFYQLRRIWDKAEENYEKALELNGKAVKASFQMGNTAFSQGKMPRAMRYYQRCNETDPRFALAYVMQGLLKIKENKKNKESITLFNRAIAADSSCMEGLFWRGFLFLAQSELKRTMEDWSTIVQMRPDAPFFRYMRAYLAIELQDYDLAFNDLRKALTAYEENQNDFRGGLTNVDKRIDIQFAINYSMRYAYGLQPETLKHFKKGFCLFLADKYEGALMELKAAESIEPAAVICFAIGLVYEYQHQNEAALTYYDKALQVDNDIFDAHKKRGLYRFQRNDYKGAYIDFAHMIRIQPQLIISYRLRGLVKFQQKDYTGAMIDFTRYIAQDTTDHEVYAKRAFSFTELKEYKRATTDYEKALELAPAEDAYYGLLSASYLQTGDTIMAYTTINKNIKRTPREYQPYVRRCDIYMMQKRWDEALKDVQSAVETLHPLYYDKQTMSDLLFLRGYILYSKGDFDGSINAFTKSLKEDRSNDQARYYRGRAFLNLGQKRDARQDLAELSGKNYLDSRQLLESLK